MKQKILAIIMCGFVLLSLADCDFEDTDKLASKEIEKIEEISKDENVEVFKGKANGEDYFTGTYEDKKLNATIKIEGESYDENQAKKREKAKEEFKNLSPLEKLKTFAIVKQYLKEQNLSGFCSFSIYKKGGLAWERF